MGISLKSKVAIITGGASGIGLAAAKSFLEAGITGLTLVDLTLAALEAAISTIPSEFHPRVLLVPADVSDEASTINYVNKTVAKFGKLDISVQNAGITHAPTKLEDMTADRFDQQMAVNVRGPFLGIKHSSIAMRSGESGGKGCSIVVTSSQLGLDGAPELSAYCSSKFAVRGLALCSAAELGVYGIRVNSIAPGPIKTPMMDNFSKANQVKLAEKAMIGRLGEANEIAEGILFLVSDNASYVTGTTLKVDGGWSRWG